MGNDRKTTTIFTAFDDYEQPEMATPERNLLRAVLMNAIADVNRPGDFSRKAKEYFLSREDDYLFSFQSVCSFLEINPRHILIIVGLDRMTGMPITVEDPTSSSDDSKERELVTADESAPTQQS